MTSISNHISAGGRNAFTVQSHAFHRRAPSIHDPHQTVKGCAEKRSHFRTVINAAHSAFSACHNFLMLHNDGAESTQETYYCNHTCLESASEQQVTDKCALTLIALVLMPDLLISGLIWNAVRPMWKSKRSGLVNATFWSSNLVFMGNKSVHNAATMVEWSFAD